MGKKSKKSTLDNGIIDNFGKLIPKTISEVKTTLEILKSFGVLSVYEHLEHPEIVPESCIKLASISLDLMAFHGDKWLFESWFEPNLERLRLRRGRVRFLLSDTCEPATFKKCKELMNRYPSVFSVKVFSENAIFRIILIDDKTMLLGHYGYEVIEGDGKNAKGWKSPQLLIENNKNWSLLIPFREMFRINWERSKELDHYLNDDLDIVTTREFKPESRK